MFYNQQLHLLQLARGQTIKSRWLPSAEPAPVWVALRSFCPCDCITSHRDALVLHPLPPPLVFKDSLDLVDVLRVRRRKQVLSTGSFSCQGIVNQRPVNPSFSLPWRRCILCLMSPKNGDRGFAANRLSEDLRQSTHVGLSVQTCSHRKQKLIFEETHGALPAEETFDKIRKTWCPC